MSMFFSLMRKYLQTSTTLSHLYWFGPTSSSVLHPSQAAGAYLLCPCTVLTLDILQHTLQIKSGLLFTLDDTWVTDGVR